MPATCALSIRSSETIFSLLIRYCRWTSTDLQQLAGNTVLHQKPAFRDLPIGVSAYERYIGAKFKSRVSLLEEHCAAMYLASSIPAPIREDQLRHCTDRLSLLDRISLASSWSHLRLCRKCAEQEFRKYRYSWWHRDHQLPLSVICSEHEFVLESTTLDFCALAMPHEITSTCLPKWHIATDVDRELAAICRLEQYLARSTSYIALETHVHAPLLRSFRQFGNRDNAEEQILREIKIILLTLSEAGQTEAIDDWERLHPRILSLIRNGTTYGDPVVAVLIAIACRRLYRLQLA